MRTGRFFGWVGAGLALLSGSGCAERLMRESMGAALGAEGRAFAFAAPTAKTAQATLPAAAPTGAAPAGEAATETMGASGTTPTAVTTNPGATLASSVSTTTSTLPNPGALSATGAASGAVAGATSAIPGAGLISGITGGGELTGTPAAPALVGYQGLTLGEITMSDGLIVPVTLDESLRSAWTSSLSEVALTADGTPAAVLNAEILHYEGANLIDAATGPFTQLIVRATLIDAATQAPLASANLVGRATSVAAGSVDGLSKGTGKALIQWLSENGVKVTGLAANLQSAAGAITDPKSLLKTPTPASVVSGAPAIPGSGATVGSAAPQPAKPIGGGSTLMGGATMSPPTAKPAMPASGMMMSPSGAKPATITPAATPMGQMAPAKR